MSYDQQSSHQQPWPSEPDPKVEILSPADDEKSQRWRLILGCSSLFLALFSGFYAYMDISTVIRATNTAAALILTVTYMTTKSTGFQVTGVGLNALIISRAAIVLRMKKVPAYPAAAGWTN